MNKLKLLTVAVALSVSAGAQATSIIMEGDYVKTAVSDNGTLGYGSGTSPGILHDVSGTGTFGIDDYLTPGSPWEIFSVSSAESGLRTNNNTGSAGITGSLTDNSATSAFDQDVNWTGAYGSYFDISTDTYFNDGDERISFTTTIFALQDLTELEFLRALDPDPDVRTYGAYDTVNGRGDGSLAAEDWVHSEGTSTGLTIGLYSDSSYTHNTGVSSSWSSDPSTYLAGVDNGDGDNTIGMAFDFGALLAGDSVTFTYHYVMGSSLGDVDIPSVPEPGSLALLALGLAGFGAARAKKKSA